MDGYIECDRHETLSFNDRSEQYFKKFANVAFEINKPYAHYKEAASISYQVGLLLCGAKIGRAQRVMEFGPRSGSLASFSHRMGNEVHLLDFSETALVIARNLSELDRRNAAHNHGPHFGLYAPGRPVGQDLRPA